MIANADLVLLSISVGKVEGYTTVLVKQCSRWDQQMSPQDMQITHAAATLFCCCMVQATELIQEKA